MATLHGIAQSGIGSRLRTSSCTDSGGGDASALSSNAAFVCCLMNSSLQGRRQTRVSDCNAGGVKAVQVFLRASFSHLYPVLYARMQASTKSFRATVCLTLWAAVEHHQQSTSGEGETFLTSNFSCGPTAGTNEQASADTTFLSALLTRLQEDVPSPLDYSAQVAL